MILYQCLSKLQFAPLEKIDKNSEHIIKNLIQFFLRPHPYIVHVYKDCRYTDQYMRKQKATNNAFL